MTHQRIRSAVPSFGLPYAWVETLCVIVLVLAIDPSTGSTPSERLPELRLADAAGAAEAKPGGDRERVVLEIDGSVKLRSQRIRATELGERLATLIAKGQTIELAIETRPDGGGHLEGFLQIQSDLSRRGLWSRTETLYRPREAPAGPTATGKPERNP